MVERRGETKEMKKQKRISQEKGITLVALIITIIVLLILAVVAIRAVQGDGIISHAKNAQTGYDKSQAEESSILSSYEVEIEKQLATSLNDEIIGTKFEKTTFVKDTTGKIFVVPAGYTIVKDDTTANTVEVDKGVVITDGISQFVWIPVSNINNMVMCQTHGASVTLDTTTLQCPGCGTNTKLAGKLYATSTGENFNASLTGQTYTADRGLREPDNLSSSYDSTSRMSIWTPTLYQGSFNKMVESVAKYGGFYVGRYETSLNGTTAQSKAGKTPMNGINWWRMYENSKTYSSSNTGLGVESEMIWGCQWDAMLKYILTTTDASHVTAENNVSHDLSSTYETGGTNYSGSVAYNDKAANIYDLEGNVREWTQEANYTNTRVVRGGNCNYGYSPSYRYDCSPTGTYSNSPTFAGGNYGSRLSLYIR